MRLYLFSFIIILFTRQTQAQIRDDTVIKTAPSISGSTYRTARMVPVVNYLRQAGKEKSLEILRDYLADGGDDGKVLVICRLLFVNPNGWLPPLLGMSIPSVDGDAVKKFPLFPFGLSNNVPFLLIEGYALEGRAESAKACLKLCEGFALIKENYSTKDYEKAALALTQVESFRNLYEAADRQRMFDMILRQAEITALTEKK